MLTTRHSLILRIRNLQDSEAWEVFVDIYGPLIYRYGMKQGLQEADATDLCQEVLREVAGCIDRFDYDNSIGKFRNWLMVVARYQLSNRRRKEIKLPRTGDTAMIRLNQEAVPDELSQQWENEYQDQLFRWASEQVRKIVAPQTWQAFWETSVKGHPPDEVAQKLGMKVGAVYVAKSRVVVRIKEKIAEVEESFE